MNPDEQQQKIFRQIEWLIKVVNLIDSKATEYEIHKRVNAVKELNEAYQEYGRLQYMLDSGWEEE